MNITLLIIFFILGTFFGSMYTVIGQRLPKNENFIIARSHCDNCNHKLSFLDMVPILSYIFLKGRCRYCHSKIDINSGESIRRKQIGGVKNGVIQMPQMWGDRAP